MHIKRWLRGQMTKRLYNEQQVALKSGAVPLAPHFAEIDHLGLYLHIPFCRQICPYCPYNKELFQAAAAERYTNAVLAEIDHYATLVGQQPVTSFYIGGGTPTTMLQPVLPKLLDAIYSTFNMQCSIHLESHPNDLSAANLNTIVDLGIKHLSIGVEAIQDHHLRTLGRPYTAAEATAAIVRAVGKGVRCVNVDLMFALPNQTHAELAAAGQTLIDRGVDQIAAYPLFSFPYTK